MVGTFEELQHFSLQSISRRASDILDTTLGVMSKEPPESVGADGRELRGAQHQSNGLHLLPTSLF